MSNITNTRFGTSPVSCFSTYIVCIHEEFGSKSEVRRFALTPSCPSLIEMVRDWKTVRPASSRSLTAAIVLVWLAALACAPATGPDDPFSQPAGGPPVSLVVSNSDLAVGDNRVSFGLVDRDYMPVRPDAVALRAVYYEPGAATGQVRYRTEAEFLSWPPDGRRGVFIADVSFDQAGTATGDTLGIWELHATFDYAQSTSEAEEPLTIGSVVSVAPTHLAPFIGDAAPLSDTPTVEMVTDLRTISSSPEPDPALYRLSVAQAVRAGKPAVITFATPAFCVTATCGPQVSDLSDLASRYEGQANFVHVEVYRDPHRIEAADPARELVPAVDEWGLVSEPWTFVVGSDGRIADRFEQYVPPRVLEAALLAAINR